MNQDNFIILKEDNYQRVLDKTLEYLEEKISPSHPRWVTPDQAMKMLNIGVSTLQKLRNEGKVVYSKISNKNIMYEYQSILDFLEENKVL